MAIYDKSRVLSMSENLYSLLNIQSHLYTRVYSPDPRHLMRVLTAAIPSCPSISQIFTIGPHLKVQMVHSAVCSQRVEGQAKEGVVGFMGKLERQLQ